MSLTGHVRHHSPHHQTQSEERSFRRIIQSSKKPFDCFHSQQSRTGIREFVTRSHGEKLALQMFLNVDWNVPGHFRDSLHVWKRLCLFVVLLIYPGADHPSLFDWFCEVSVRGETDWNFQPQRAVKQYKVNFWVKYSNQNIMFFMAEPFDQTEKSSASVLNTCLISWPKK